MISQSRFNSNLTRTNYNLQLMQVTKQNTESLILNRIFCNACKEGKKKLKI